MSAPSFSSFPSFNSFPDLDPGPSKPSSKKPEESKRSDKDRKKGEKDKKKNDKKGERHKKHDLSSVDEEPRHKKGRRRRDEDDHRKHDKFLESRIEPRDIESTTRTLYYSDRRGDQLNLTYGGLHAGDVPRYNLVCRKCHGYSSGNS